MTGQDWEHCKLELRRSGDDLQNTYLGVHYFGLTGHIHKRFDEVDPSSGFYDALSQLGAGGWEMISIQHANAEYQYWSTKHSKSYKYASLRPYQVVAYFKRPAQTDRDASKPELRL